MLDLKEACATAETLATEANMGRPLAVTLSGSRLLGTFKEKSDWDFYVVAYPTRRQAVGLENPLKSAHKMADVGGFTCDYTLKTFGAFLEQVVKGSPNATNVLWAPVLHPHGVFGENKEFLLTSMRHLVSVSTVSSLLGWALQEQGGDAKQRLRAAAHMNLALDYSSHSRPLFRGAATPVPTYEEVKRELKGAGAPLSKPDPEAALFVETLWTDYLMAEYFV